MTSSTRPSTCRSSPTAARARGKTSSRRSSIGLLGRRCWQPVRVPGPVAKRADQLPDRDRRSSTLLRVTCSTVAATWPLRPRSPTISTLDRPPTPSWRSPDVCAQVPVHDARPGAASTRPASATTASSTTRWTAQYPDRCTTSAQALGSLRRTSQGSGQGQEVRLHHRRQRRLRLVVPRPQDGRSSALRPLAVHFDNTWNSPIATANIFAVLDKLGVDLETYVVDNNEYDDIYRSFMLAGVKDIEAPTDIGFMGVLYRAAEKHGIKHIVEGPLVPHRGRLAPGMAVHGRRLHQGGARAVRPPADEDLPEHGLRQFVKWAAFSRIQRHRPLYYLDYNKEDDEAVPCRHVRLAVVRRAPPREPVHGVLPHLLPARLASASTSGRSSCPRSCGPASWTARTRRAQFIERPGRRSRDPRDGEEAARLQRRRVRARDDDAEARTTRDYPTYKRRFERLRPFFWLLYKLDRVPKSFYVKFCIPRRAA